MIDHVGFAVSDYERAKVFYAKALAPLGYVLIMEVGAHENASGYPAAGFGVNGKPDFWIGGEGKLEKPLHIAVVAKDRAAVDAFHRAALAAGGKDNGAPGLRPRAVTLDAVHDLAVLAVLALHGDRDDGVRRRHQKQRREHQPEQDAWHDQHQVEHGRQRLTVEQQAQRRHE